MTVEPLECQTNLDLLSPFSQTLTADRSIASAPRIATFKGYVNVPSNNESALMEAVALHGPVAVSIDAKHPEFKFYSEGVSKQGLCCAPAV